MYSFFFSWDNSILKFFCFVSQIDVLIFYFILSPNSSSSSRLSKIPTSLESEMDLNLFLSSISTFIDFFSKASSTLKLKCFYFSFYSLASSLKSLMVIKEFSMERMFLGFFWDCYFFILFLQMYPLQNFWILTMLRTINLISSMYFRVRYPRNVFWIVMAAFVFFRISGS